MTFRIDEFDASTTEIDGLLQLSAKAVTDDRGTVREFFRASEHGTHTVPTHFAQINLTWTKRGALRGLHGEATTKLVGVAYGEAFGAYLDARPDSPTRGVVVTVPLIVGMQILVPPGVCNGFQATSEPGCQYLYCFDTEWTPGMPGVAVNPLDPQLAIAWPIAPDPSDPSLISAKDAGAPLFAELG